MADKVQRFYCKETGCCHRRVDNLLTGSSLVIHAGETHYRWPAGGLRSCRFWVVTGEVFCPDCDSQRRSTVWQEDNSGVDAWRKNVKDGVFLSCACAAVWLKRRSAGAAGMGQGVYQNRTIAVGEPLSR